MAEIEEKVWAKLKEVLDPEFGRPIYDRGLIDEVAIEGSKVRVTFHLTVPFCPDPFALHIGHEIREKVLDIPEIESVEVLVTGHNNADKLNAQLEE
ncbi:MAG: metal-sulfur cluster assembly factor [Candidatus Thorarchaeota archaeon]